MENFRKVTMIIIVTFGLFPLASLTLAKDKGKNVEKEPSIQEIKVQDDAEMTDLLKQAQETLNNTQWQIKLIQITSAEKKRTSMDALRFMDHKVVSEKLLSKGFQATSYSLSLKGENLVIWETMQTNQNQDMVLLKGEIEGEMMRGVLSQQRKDKPAKDYSFVSTSKKAIKEEITAAQRIERPSPEVLEETQKNLKKEEKEMILAH